MITVNGPNNGTMTLNPELSARTASYVANQAYTLRRELGLDNDCGRFKRQKGSETVVDPGEKAKAFCFLIERSLVNREVRIIYFSKSEASGVQNMLDPNPAPLVSLSGVPANPNFALCGLSRPEIGTAVSYWIEGRTTERVQKPHYSQWQIRHLQAHHQKVVKAPLWLVQRAEALQKMPRPSLEKVRTQLKASAEARQKLDDKAKS